MRRREFISLLGGAAPLAARGARAAAGDAGDRVPRPVSPNEELLRGFRQGLNQAGFIEGENVAIVYRSAENENRSIAGTSRRSGSPAGRGYCSRISHGGGGGEGGYRDDPYRLHRRRRPGQARFCRQPRPARRQPDRDQFFRD